MFGVVSCIDAANCGRLDDWIYRYLSNGPWANADLRDGLRLQRRYWIGPLLVPLQKLERCCGPEPGMEFPVATNAWENKISRTASGLNDPKNLPPLIVEWRVGVLTVCDGNHRHGAMTTAGWSDCWAIVGCNTSDDYVGARAALGAARR